MTLAGMQPQFFGGGPAVRVRNTFLDCDDHIHQSEVRATSLPAREVREMQCKQASVSAPEVVGAGLRQVTAPQQAIAENLRTGSVLETQHQIVTRLAPLAQQQHQQNQEQSSTSFASPPSIPSTSQSNRVDKNLQPQTLTCHFYCKGGWQSAHYHVLWVVDARKLYGNDKQVVSPPFDICLGAQFPQVTFKLLIYPKSSHDVRGGSAFKKSGGRGFVQLKCEEDVSHTAAHVAFSVTIGNGHQAEPPRGPVSHNFGKRAVGGLLKSQELWDFGEFVDNESMTFNVLLEMWPQSTEAGRQAVQQSGSQAARQSGSQAVRQSGSQAVRQSGSQAVTLLHWLGPGPSPGMSWHYSEKSSPQWVGYILMHKVILRFDI